MAVARDSSPFSVRYETTYARPHVVVAGVDVSNYVLEIDIHEKPGQLRTATMTVLLDNMAVHQEAAADDQS